MKLSFKRITSTGSFIPEIDGLRFIAIISVVLMHISTFINVKDLNKYSDIIDYSCLKNIIAHGHFGVQLFFVISGFILGLPFAKYFIANEKKVNIKNYFLRRLTRLEPPYILIMTILLFSLVFFSKSIDFNNGIKSYFASIIYSHNFIYGIGVFPKLNDVAWSLEIEVQFYTMAPIMAYIFSIKSPSLRRLIFVLIGLFSLFLANFISLPFISLINYLAYFIIGFLLADLYVSKTKIHKKTKSFTTYLFN